MNSARNRAASLEPRTESLGAAHDADTLHAWARHVLAANGFGDADLALVSRRRAPVDELQRPSHGIRAYRSSEIAFALGASLAEAVSAAWHRWQRRRDARAALSALKELDARTQRDIGLGSGTFASLAAELPTNRESTRFRALFHGAAF